MRILTDSKGVKEEEGDDDWIIEVETTTTTKFKASVLVIDALAREELIKIDSRSLRELFFEKITCPICMVIPGDRYCTCNTPATDRIIWKIFIIPFRLSAIHLELLRIGFQKLWTIGRRCDYLSFFRLNESRESLHRTWESTFSSNSTKEMCNRR